MKNFPEFYILGLPIETEIGMCNFVKVKDIPEFGLYQNVLTYSKEYFLQEFMKNGMTTEEANRYRKEASLYSIIEHIPDLYQTYASLFGFVFKDDSVFEKITEQNFDYYRKMIMTMNAIKEEIINPNPEIQAFIEKSKKAQAGEPIHFEDIISSVVTYTGNTYKEINETTLYQLNMTFGRIAQFKNYDTNTLFATVSTEKINIDSWCKHIDLFEEPKHGVSRDEFNQMTGSIFGGK